VSRGDPETTRRLRYSVAASVNGFIAPEDVGYGWIIEESAIDFVAHLWTLATLLMGRLARSQGWRFRCFFGKIGGVVFGRQAAA
jgi:hypothetical protein|tara:strand:+ start:229 stop:480 length:252 start_codon:yes stop_codon:yes gene_type:complete